MCFQGIYASLLVCFSVTVISILLRFLLNLPIDLFIHWICMFFWWLCYILAYFLFYGNSIQPVIVYKQSWVTWQEDPSKYHGLVSSFIIFYVPRLIVHAILHQFLGFIICWFLACYLVMVSPNTLCCLPLFFLLYCWSSNKNWLV
jgi:hypothetical protein